jgi:hypothetical protein
LKEIASAPLPWRRQQVPWPRGVTRLMLCVEELAFAVCSVRGHDKIVNQMNRMEAIQ